MTLDDGGDAAADTPIENRTNWRRLIQTTIHGIGYLSLGLALGALGPTIQPLASQMHVSIADMGWLFAARGVGSLIGSLLLGKLYDLGLPSVIFSACALLMAIGLYIIALLPPFAVVVVAHSFLGIGVGLADTGGNTMTVWLWEGHPMMRAALQYLVRSRCHRSIDRMLLLEENSTAHVDRMMAQTRTYTYTSTLACLLWSRQRDRRRRGSAVLGDRHVPRHVVRRGDRCRKHGRHRAMARRAPSHQGIQRP